MNSEHLQAENFSEWWRNVYSLSRKGAVKNVSSLRSDLAPMRRRQVPLVILLAIVLVAFLSDGYCQPYPAVTLDLSPQGIFLQNGFVGIQWNTTNPKFDVLIGSAVADGITNNPFFFFFWTREWSSTSKAHMEKMFFLLILVLSISVVLVCSLVRFLPY